MLFRKDKWWKTRQYYIHNIQWSPSNIFSKIIETVALQTNDLLLVSVYIPPGRNAIKDMENMLQQVELTVSRNQIKWIVVIGDFNLAFQQLSNVEQMMRRYDLSQLVSEPTHELGAILDVAFTNIKDVSVRNLPV